MTRRVRCAVGAALAAAVLLSVATAAQAGQKTVDMGLTAAAQKTFQKTGSDVNDFFPHRVTIHVGDTVRFVPDEFHTVDLPGRRTSPLALFLPTGVVAGSLDAAGAPFWFNGQPSLGFNPALLSSGFGKTRTYSGAAAVLSGLPVANKPKPMVVRFTKAGSFRYFCDVHPGMTGRVVVLPKRRPVPTAKADRAAVKAQLATDLGRAKTLASSAKPPANTVDVGLQAAGNVSFFGFVPSTLTVPVGTTVTFRMGAASEVHTATTGPGDPEHQPASYLGQIAASLGSPAPDAKGLYPSDPPPAPAALTPVLHGNGFWSSGGLDLNPATPSPPANAVTFTAPGTYQVYCMIHPFMHATIVAR